MKNHIEQAVLEMIKKSGVELGEGELESIIDASFNTASEHISNALSCIPLKEGATHTSVLVWYAKTPEMPGTVQKRVALVAFIVPVGCWSSIMARYSDIRISGIGLNGSSGPTETGRLLCNKVSFSP